MRRLCLAALASFACADTSEPAADDADTTAAGSDDDGGSSTTGEAATVFFHEDVAPIFAAACNGCHREGGVAPFSLQDYDTAAMWAGSIRTAVAARTMPPFNVTADGSCNEFLDARWLTPDELDTIVAWVDQGTARGDAQLGVPAPPEPGVLGGQRQLALQTPADYQPINEDVAAAPADDYQCFLLDPGFEQDAFLVGFDVQPGNDRIVHHVLAFDVDPAATSLAGGRNDALLEQLDAQSPEPGWDCFNAAGDGVMVQGVPITWAPGTGATNFPAGTGIRLRAGHKLVVQMHYHLAGDDGSDQTAITLALADGVEREAHAALMDGFLATLLGTPAELPPGRTDASFEWSVRLRDIPNLGMGADVVEAELLGVLPHMHQRGRRMWIDLDRAAGPACGARIPQWDYDWQQAYYYEQPIPVSMEDRLHVRCEWDTTDSSEPVLPGLGTDAEMCLAGVYLVERG
ncbi:MAG: hypothetical protein K1X88_20440 [Nannocystaceae bacterium]|nr:hypothetical protein [Nannocystaceae bacterium]